MPITVSGAASGPRFAIVQPSWEHGTLQTLVAHSTLSVSDLAPVAQPDRASDF
jgi:hypothetical protein